MTDIKPRKLKGTELTPEDLSDVIVLTNKKPDYTVETVTIPGWGINIVLHVNGTYRIIDTIVNK